MPKQKTHSGASKRFRVTKSGRLKFLRRAKRRHNLGHRTTNEKRQKRVNDHLVTAVDQDRVARMLCLK